MRRIYHDQAYAASPVGSYWEAITPVRPLDPPLDGDRDADVVIVGAGYTGLSAALHLARDFGCAPVVLEAQEVGWGASGRNGGFNCMGGGKLGRAAYERRYGAGDYARYLRGQVAACAMVEELTADWDVGRQEAGEWSFAHRVSDFEGFAAEADMLRTLAGLACEILSPGDLEERGLSLAGHYGAMRTPAGFPLNPRAYVQAMADAAIAAGATIHARTPVSGIAQDGSGIAVTTPAGRIRAKRLILAGNGYNSEDLPGWMAGRYMPVISHVMVTEPLGGGNWLGTAMAYDTRNMLHYFRRLPDGRMLFGMRGAANDGPDARTRMLADLRADFAAMFPDWADARAEHHWAGLVCMTGKLLPYVGPLGEISGAWTALAYHGNGVSQATWCGRHVARLAMGDVADGLPDSYRAQPRRIPFGAARRALLPLAFGWYAWKDR